MLHVSAYVHQMAHEIDKQLREGVSRRRRRATARRQRGTTAAAGVELGHRRCGAAGAPGLAQRGLLLLLEAGADLLQADPDTALDRAQRRMRPRGDLVVLMPPK